MSKINSNKQERGGSCRKIYTVTNSPVLCRAAYPADRFAVGGGKGGYRDRASWQMTLFVRTKMQAEGGQTLRAILAIKEAERRARDDTFWWGVGNSLGTAVQEAAKNSDGTLPILFLMMPSKPQRRDSHPDQVCLWNFWEDRAGGKHDIPKHVLEWSRGANNKKMHYALVCHSPEPLVMGVHVFDQSRWLTPSGKRPDARQVTALLRGDLDGDHSQGDYCLGFRATLVDPWQVKLVEPHRLSPKKRKLLASWKKGDDWGNFVARFRGKGRHQDSK